MNVYLFELDSVRNSEQEIESGQEALFRETAIYGNTVVMTLNQVADSAAFWACLNQRTDSEQSQATARSRDAIITLCKNGRIVTSQYGEMRTAAQYLVHQIQKCQSSKGGDYLFSLIPNLRTHTSGSDLLEDLKCAIQFCDLQLLKEKGDRFASGETQDLELAELYDFLYHYAEIILLLSQQTNALPPRKSNSATLCEIISRVKDLQSQADDASPVRRGMQVMLEIQEKADRSSWNPNSRSDWYLLLQNACGQEAKEEDCICAEAIVDLCYNHVLLESIYHVEMRYDPADPDSFKTVFYEELDAYLQEIAEKKHVPYCVDQSRERQKQYLFCDTLDFPKWENACGLIQRNVDYLAQNADDERITLRDYDSRKEAQKRRWEALSKKAFYRSVRNAVINVLLYVIISLLIGEFRTWIINVFQLTTGLGASILFEAIKLVVFGLISSEVLSLFKVTGLVETFSDLKNGIRERKLLRDYRGGAKEGIRQPPYHETEAWQRYLELQAKRPEDFRSGELEILTDEEQIDEFCDRTGKKLGVLYESDYHLLVVDLVRSEKTGAPFAYERMLPAKAGAVVAIPHMEDGKIVLLKQFRHAIREDGYAFPRGFGEAGISAEENLKKELREELGAEHISDIRCIGSVAPDSGILASRAAVYACRVDQLNLHMGEEGILGVETVDAEMLDRMIAEGKISDGCSLAAWSLYCSRR